MHGTAETVDADSESFDITFIQFHGDFIRRGGLLDQGVGQVQGTREAESYSESEDLFFRSEKSLFPVVRQA